MAGNQVLIVAVSVALAGAFIFQFAEKFVTFGGGSGAGGGGPPGEDARPPGGSVLVTRIVGLLMMLGGGLAAGALALGVVG